MPRKPSHPIHKFTAEERAILQERLAVNDNWKNRKYIGPRQRGACIIVKKTAIHNPFYPKGPRNLSLQQLVFIVKYGHLADNRKVRNTKHQIDLSHVCGRELCINIADRHFVAEEHWRNILRRRHHNLIKNLFRGICKRILELASNVSKRKLRANTTKKAFVRCVECPLDVSWTLKNHFVN